MIKRFKIPFLIFMMLLLTLACGLPNLGTSTPTSAPVAPAATSRPGPTQVPPPTSVPAVPSSPQATVETPFPTPPDAKNVIVNGNMLNFQTALSLKDAMSFYRDVFTKQAMKENGTLTVTSDNTFSMVFEGTGKFKRIVVQGVALGKDSTNVNVRPE